MAVRFCPGILKKFKIQMLNVTNRREVIKFIIIRTIGNFLVLTSLWGIGMTLGPAAYLELLYRFNQLRNVRYELSFLPSKAEEIKIEEELPVSPTPAQIAPVNTTFFGQLAGGDKIEFIEPVSSQFAIV